MINRHSNDFFRAAIKSLHPGAWDIRVPPVPGNDAHVFFADTPNGTFVYKFNSREIIMRNRVVSNVLRLYDIPAPVSTAHAYMKTYFESYPYCPAKTLYEHMSNGISDEKIFNVYRAIVKIQYKLSQIDPREFTLTRDRYFSQIYRTNIRRHLWTPVADACAYLVFALSRYGRQRFFHNDLHPKNILVSDDGHLVQILDLDAVAMSNVHFSMIKMLQSYPLDNGDALIDEYEFLAQRRMSRAAITAGTQFMRFASIRRKKLDRPIQRGE